jgi:hypothetical protein
VLNLDAAPSAKALAAVMECPGIRSAQVVTLPAAGQLPGWLAGAGSAQRSRPV